jgi:hypothetical protein
MKFHSFNPFLKYPLIFSDRSQTRTLFYYRILSGRVGEDGSWPLQSHILSLTCTLTHPRFINDLIISNKGYRARTDASNCKNNLANQEIQFF